MSVYGVERLGGGVISLESNNVIVTSEDIASAILDPMITDGNMFALELTLENASDEVVTEGVKDVFQAIKEFILGIIEKVKNLFKKVFGKIGDSINDKEWNGNEPNRKATGSSSSDDEESSSSSSSSSSGSNSSNAVKKNDSDAKVISGSSSDNKSIGAKSEPLGLPQKKLHTYKDLVGIKLKDKTNFVYKRSLSVVDQDITDKIVMAMPYKVAARHIIETFSRECQIERFSGGYSGKHFTEDLYQGELDNLKKLKGQYDWAIDKKTIYEESDTIKQDYVDTVLKITGMKKSTIVNSLNKTSQEAIKQLNELEKSVGDDLEKQMNKMHERYKGEKFQYEEADIAKCTSVVGSIYRLGSSEIYKYTVDAIGAVNGVITTARGLRRKFDRLIHQLDVSGEVQESVSYDRLFTGFSYY